MTAIIKNTLKVNSAKSFLKTFSDATSNHYLFVGKSLPWSNELSPEVPTDTQKTDAKVWDEMIGLKKILAGDVSLVVPRSDWKSGTIYFPYDDSDEDLLYHPTSADAASFPDQALGKFYVLNSDGDLFICIDNNVSSPSTNEPGKPTTLTSLVTTPDGYVWKYITTIEFGSNKFVTDNWIPIQTLSESDTSEQATVQSGAVPGQLLRVVVSNVAGSSSFEYAHTGTLEVVDANTVKLTTEGDFPWDGDAEYAGYNLRVTSPDGSSEETFEVSSNASSGGNKYVTLTSSISSSDFPSDSTYKLLPKIVIGTNGNAENLIDVIPTLDVNNKIKGFTIVSRGSDASSVIITVNKPTNFVGSFVAPTIRCVLDSFRGLGKDPEKDLGASFVMVATKIKYDEAGNDFTKSNDYRQIGIIKNVYGGSTLASSSTLRPTKKLTVQFTEGTSFSADSELSILSSSEEEIGQIRVLDFDSAGTLTYIQTEDTGYTSPSIGNILDSGSGTKANITQIDASEVSKLKGEILYLENRRPVIRAEGQTEEIKTIIEF